MRIGKQFSLLIILLFTLTGCSAVQLVVSFAPEVEELRQGEREFELGNFEDADAIFARIYESHDNPQTKNTALYNLTCTRIMTAKNNEDYLAAVTLLDDWQQTYPSVIYVENPNMVISALKEHSSLFAKDLHEARKQKKKITALIKRGKKDKAVIESQIKTIEDLKDALNTLQQQITELEAIDQQLQEKKKPL